MGKRNNSLRDKDLYWEQDFKSKVIQPKKNFHNRKRFKDNFSNDFGDTNINKHKRSFSKIEESFLEDYYINEDEYEGYRIK